MSYKRFIEQYGENVKAFTNALINVENLVNIKIDNKKVIITNDKLFNELNKVPGSSILKNLIGEINDGILGQLNKLNTGMIKNHNEKDSILFSSNYLRAAYIALALALNQVAGKDDNENRNKLILLEISNEQLATIKSINFDSIKKLLKEMSIKLFEQYKVNESNQDNDFANDLVNEMINLINDVEFKLSGDSNNNFSPEFVDFRTIQLFGNGENKSFVDRLIEKIFNYLKRPIDWIRNKASNSKNIVFLNEFKQINSFVVVIENFITKKTPIEKLYFKLSKIKKQGEKLSEELRVFLGNILKNWNNKNKLRDEFSELFPYLIDFGNALKIEENEKHTENNLIKEETDKDTGNLNKTQKSEIKKSADRIIKYIMTFLSNFKTKLSEDSRKNYERMDLPILKKYFGREIEVD
ncbi:unnamed protein product [Meloidogyne enterolobii]|uniref:Uncharacterized protein n=1 Tax=Meloidogyne enterolobii TaxID=390850 RepID=A0ACB1B4B4_MELEN